MNRGCTWVLAFLLLIAAGTNEHACGQNRTTETLSSRLKELSSRHKLKISFSPSITDKIYPRRLLNTKTDPLKALEELLKGSGMTFKRVGVTYIIVKEPQKEPEWIPKVVPPKRSKPAKVIPTPPTITPVADTIVVRDSLRSSATPCIASVQWPLPLPIIAPPRRALTVSTPPRTTIKRNLLALKTNLLYGATTFTPNLGIEVALGRQTTLSLSGGYNWFNLNSHRNNNKKLVHWIVQPGFRYFLHERFDGHFLGTHALYSQYNIGRHELPMLFGKGSKEYRHEGWAIGAGLSYGYLLALGRSWNMEFSAGLGYLRLSYDRYDCPQCGTKVDEKTKNYFGPTQAAISLIYIIK